MKTKACFFALPALLLTFLLVGCRQSAMESEVVSEGVLYSVTYTTSNGTIGLTRFNSVKAVPGDTGTWNADAYGRLTHDFLFITRPQHPEQGPLVIPVTRLVDVQFGDGGIKRVDETHPAP